MIEHTTTGGGARVTHNGILVAWICTTINAKWRVIFACDQDDVLATSYEEAVSIVDNVLSGVHDQ